MSSSRPRPRPADTRIYVNPFSLCGALGANYVVTVTQNGVQTDRYFGEAIAAEQRAGGYGTGDFIANIEFLASHVLGDP